MAKILEHTFLASGKINRTTYLAADETQWRIGVSDIDIETHKHLPYSSRRVRRSV